MERLTSKRCVIAMVVRVGEDEVDESRGRMSDEEVVSTRTAVIYSSVSFLRYTSWEGLTPSEEWQSWIRQRAGPSVLR